MNFMVRSFILCCVSLFISLAISAGSPQVTYSLNEFWKFSKIDSPANQLVGIDDSEWEKVDLPHTWNKEDANDDIPEYFRGVGWYRKSILISEDKKDKLVYIRLSAANQDTEFFVNGQSVGRHAGGYTAFCFDITNYIQFGALNQFAIKVNNSYNPNIPPLSADFTFFGGINRDVNLVFKNKIHYNVTNYASSGIYISTPKVTDDEGTVAIKSIIKNKSLTSGKLKIATRIVDANGKQVANTSYVINYTDKNEDIQKNETLKIIKPLLWSPDSPHLYIVISSLYDAKTNQLLDEQINPLAFRWFGFSADKGFFLNGKPLKLIGVNRHEHYLNKGNALSDEINLNDVKLIKALGVNFLRIAHYPHDKKILEMCDKLGILCSVEIPIVNTITESEEFTTNCLNMGREMVLQNYNHPSVIIWAYMNEIMLRPPFKSDSLRHEKYMKSLNVLATKIEKQIREDDPYRCTMIPCHGGIDSYIKAGLTEIPMVLGFNIYSGWYTPNFEGLDRFFEIAREKIPHKPIMITEYGADVAPNLHSFAPLRYDYTQEYANLYHEYYLKKIMETPFIAGAAIWNFNDFYSEERANAIPHVNNKGIVTLDRQKKDTYYQYQAALLKTPFIGIASKNWTIRGGVLDIHNTCLQPLKVYSNLDTLSLCLNGKYLEKKTVKEKVVIFNVPFTSGENRIEVSGVKNGKSYVDQLVTDFRGIPYQLNNVNVPFSSINVMLGSQRYYQDKTNAVLWIPEQEYVTGAWGYIGGRAYRKKTRFGEQPASDLNILGTTDDPVFQTMREGIEKFKFDVPDGLYTLSFYWSELYTNKAPNSVVYNLGDDAMEEKLDKRVFNVEVNELMLIQNFDIAREFGENIAVVKKFQVVVKEGKGITINFSPIEGEPILNAIRVYRNY